MIPEYIGVARPALAIGSGTANQATKDCYADCEMPLWSYIDAAQALSDPAYQEAEGATKRRYLQPPCSVVASCHTSNWRSRIT